jgi:hypothetical protein
MLHISSNVWKHVLLICFHDDTMQRDSVKLSHRRFIDKFLFFLFLKLIMKQLMRPLKPRAWRITSGCIWRFDSPDKGFAKQSPGLTKCGWRFAWEWSKAEWPSKPEPRRAKGPEHIQSCYVQLFLLLYYSYFVSLI